MQTTRKTIFLWVTVKVKHSSIVYGVFCRSVCCALHDFNFSFFFFSVCVVVCEDRRKPTKNKSPQKTRIWALRIFFPLSSHYSAIRVFSFYYYSFFSYSLRNSFLFFCCHVILTTSVTQILTTMFYIRVWFMFGCVNANSWIFIENKEELVCYNVVSLCICMNIEHASTFLFKNMK